MSQAYREGYNRIFGDRRQQASREKDAAEVVVAGYAFGMPVILDPAMPKDSVEIRSFNQIARWDPVNGCVAWVTVTPSVRLYP